MQKLFLRGLGITLLLNLLVKPATIFMVDIKMQNELGLDSYGIFQTMLNFTFLFSMLLDMGITNFMTRMIAQHPHMIHKYSNRLFTFRLILVLVYILWTVSLFFILRFSFEWLWVLGLLIMHQISIITVNYVRAYTGGLLKFGLDAVLSVVERSVYFVFGSVLIYTTFIEPLTLQWFAIIFVGSSTISLIVATIIYLRIVALPKLHWDSDFFKRNIGKLELLYDEANWYSYNAWIFHSITFIPMCFTVVFGTLLTANGSLRILNQIAFLSLVTMSILNVLLIPFFGAVGAAIASLVAQSTLGVLQYLVVRYKMKHRLASNTWLKLIVLSVLMVVAMFLEIKFQWNQLYYAFGIGLLWILLVFGLKIIDLVQVLKMLNSKGDSVVVED